MRRTIKKTQPDKNSVKEDRAIPVWLQATESFYGKLNRVAAECGLSRYETLSRGLDAVLRQTTEQKSPLNAKIKSAKQRESFRKTMGQVSRKYWASLSSEEKRVRAQNSANARWRQREKVGE
jgi:hypothetical protein